MRHVLVEGLRAGWDAVIATTLLAREFALAFLACAMDIVSSNPVPHIDLQAVNMASEPAAESTGRREAA